VSAINDASGAGRHLGELAELYAIGVLEPGERMEVEKHVAECAACARALGAAESTVAALDDAFVPPVEPPERLGSRIAASAATVVPLVPRREVPRAAWRVPAFSAAAAALLLGGGIGGGALVEHSADVRQAARDSAVLATIATSHFNHVTFTARTAGVPVSKVLYARDGAWFYVVIAGSSCDCRVVARSAAGERDFGKADVRGDVATLFARTSTRPAALELVDATGHTVSAATLVYSAR
jgi:hypothetical protein